ncbi:lactonase family protein [Caballeronia mineralivorans]|uniref:lactonase family protein n=1 Tax=Caballeronia mineralivorans TaxID=2010198 RepID=UPI0007C74A0F|nr:lactonase family protein [Caballeronia mineralivorans]
MVTRVVVMAALAMLTLSAGAYSEQGRAATLPKNAQTELVYVGTQERRIHALRFDAYTGKLTMIGPVEEGLRSTWLVAHPQLPILYSVDDQNTEEGSVTAYAVDRGNGALTKVNAVATGGNGTTYLWLDVPSMTLLGANYSSGSVSSIVINREASMGSLVSTIKETGSGPNRRQASAHAHSVAVDPSGRYALVADLGADRVFVYGFDRATHALSPDDEANPRSFIAPPGSGPRHLAFGLNGQFVYLLTELTAEIMVLRWGASQGHLTLVQSLPTTSPEFQGAKSGAEIAVSHDGRFVYVGNRGENALVVYRVSPDSGELSLVQRTSSGGQRPWGFAIDASGKWMLVENQSSGKVNVFRIDPVSGMVSDTGQSVDVPAPVSVVFVK